MNRIPKFAINDVVYTINDYKIGRGTITAIVYVELEKGEQLNYEVLCADQKKRIVNEAYIVKTLNDAKESAKQNAERIYTEMLVSIGNLTEEIFNQAYNKNDTK
jgi:hypothetical protein